MDTRTISPDLRRRRGDTVEPGHEKDDGKSAAGSEEDDWVYASKL